MAKAMGSGNARLRSYGGAVAVITGGVYGIGEALGKDLANHGCDVVLAGLNCEQAREVAASICARGGKSSAHALDVTDAQAVEALLQATVNRCGRLDNMFNNVRRSISLAYDYSLHDTHDKRGRIPQSVGWLILAGDAGQILPGRKRHAAGSLCEEGFASNCQERPGHRHSRRLQNALVYQSPVTLAGSETFAADLSGDTEAGVIVFPTR
jgi:hypothetical protein